MFLNRCGNPWATPGFLHFCYIETLPHTVLSWWLVGGLGWPRVGRGGARRWDGVVHMGHKARAHLGPQGPKIYLTRFMHSLMQPTKTLSMHIEENT